MNGQAQLVPLAAELAAFESISLDELNAEAELQTRVDRKYILNAAALPALIGAMSSETRVLEVGGSHALRYESQYFDTPRLDSYLGAAQSRRRRFKVRTRSYLDSDASFLEVKTRGGRSTTVKERVPLAPPAAGIAELDTAGRRYAEEVLADACIPSAEQIARTLRPNLATSYRRITLLLAGDVARGASRATIDLELRWHELGGTTLNLPAAAIVETKSARHAGELDHALWHLGHRPAQLSKYATGLAAMHPALPSNKWHRTLNRFFHHRDEAAPAAAFRRASLQNGHGLNWSTS